MTWANETTWLLRANSQTREEDEEEEKQTEEKMNSGFFVSVSGVQEMKYSSCTVAIFGCVGRRPVRSVYGNWAQSVWIHRLWCQWQFSRCSAGSVRGQHRTAPYKEEGSAIERCLGKRLWTCTASQCVDCTANATLTPHIWADGRNEKKEARKGRRQGNKNRKEETIKRN